MDKKKLQDLSCELQRKEEWLQEERAERDQLEAELGREKVSRQNRHQSEHHLIHKHLHGCKISCSVCVLETGEACQSSEQLFSYTHAGTNRRASMNSK